MPYHIITKDGQHCVAKEGEDTPIDGGCHPTAEAAQKHLAALEANVPDAAKAEPGIADDIILAVKAIEGEPEAIEILVPYNGPFKGKDSQRESFGADTDFSLPGVPDVPRPILHYHSLEDRSKPEVIGSAVSFRDAPEGRWYKAILDKAKPLAQQMLKALGAGKLRASSGAVSHMVRKVSDGLGQHITNWPIVEISLVDEGDGRHRAVNPYGVVKYAAKAALSEVGLESPDLNGGEEAELTQPIQPSEEGTPTQPIQEDNPMAEIDIKKEIADGVAAALAAQKQADADAKAASEAEQGRIDEAVKAALKAEEDKRAAAGRRLPGGAPYVAEFSETWKYDNLDAGTTALLIGLMDTAAKAGQRKEGPTEAAYKALALKIGEDKSDVGVAAHMAMKAQNIPDDPAAIKANEVMNTATSGGESDWVGVAYSTDLWLKIRAAAVILDRIPAQEVPQGSQTWVMPLESTDMIFYKIGETTDQNATTLFPNFTVPLSPVVSASKTLSLAKSGARVAFSMEQQEDNLFPLVEQYRYQFAKAAAEQMEHLIIDGDTTTSATTNINNIGGTPTSTDLYLSFNGFRKSPLVTTTSLSRSAGGTLVDDDYLQTAQLMGAAGLNAMDPTKVSFITDFNTAYKTARLLALKTKDVYSNPTIENGMIKSIYGYEVLPSFFMHFKSATRKANTSGKVDQNTTTNNTTGSIVAVRWDQWKLGWKRHIKLEAFHWPQSDSDDLTCTVRWGLAQRDTNASSITYNVGLS